MKNEKQINQNEINNGKKSKRIGAAKEEMKEFDISLEELNSIELPDFEN